MAVILYIGYIVAKAQGPNVNNGPVQAKTRYFILQGIYLPLLLLQG